MYQIQKDINGKTKFIKCASLLSQKTKEAQDEFLVEFLPKIKSITDKVYFLYQEELDGFYDYEDFFCDMVLLAGELFESKKFRETGLSDLANLFNYTKYLMYQSLHFLNRTYCVKTSHVKGMEIIKVLRVYRDFIDSEKRRPTLVELEQLTQISQRKLSNILYMENYDDLEMNVPSFENELINRIVKGSLKDDLDMALETIVEEEKAFICTLNGYNCEMINQTEYAKKDNTTRQNVHQKAKRVYQKILDNNEYLHSYRD